LRRTAGAARQIGEAVLERAEVAAVQPARGQHRHRRAADGQHENRRRLRRRRQQHRGAHERATDAIPQAIEADVDQRLGRPLLGGWNRRVKEFVAGTEERAAEHRLTRPRDEQAAEAGNDEAGEAAGEQRPRRRPRRHREAESLEHHPRRRRLEHERQQAGAGVVQREEAEQIVAAAEGRNRFGLEQVVHQGRAGRAEQNERRQVAQVRRLGQHAKRRPQRSRVRRVVDPARRAGRRAHRGVPHEPGAAELQQCEHWKHRRNPEHGGDALRHQCAHQAAQRAGGGDVAEPLLRRVRVEALAGDEPEARREHRTGGGNMKVDRDSGPEGRVRSEEPLQQEQHAAGGERDRDPGRRLDAARHPGIRDHQDDRHRRGGHQHGRQRREVKGGEEQRVPNGLAAHELRHDSRGTKHRGDNRTGPGALHLKS
jgi:hypothetical protein